jgi:hypothetical protein
MALYRRVMSVFEFGVLGLVLRPEEDILFNEEKDA